MEEHQNPQPYSEKPNPGAITQTFFENGSFPFDDEPNNIDDYVAKMENLKAFIFKSAIVSSPTKSLSPVLRSLVEQRLHDLFPDFRVPDHPPYAAMIEAAITKLNEEGGSSEEAISQFIRNEYTDLPKVHEILLKHHLEKLCEDEVFAKAGDKFYMPQEDVATEQTPVGACVLNQIITRSSTLSPICHVDDEPSYSGKTPSSSSSWSSSVSWSSSASFDSFPSRKRKRQYPRRQKSVRKRGRQRKRTTKRSRIYLDRAAKRKCRINKKAKVKKESQVNADILMLEGIKDSKEKAEKKEEHHVLVQVCDPVTKKKRTLIDINLDELQDMVNEDLMEQDSQEKSFIKENSRIDVFQKQKQAQSHHIQGIEGKSCSLLKQTEEICKGKQHQLQQAEADVARLEDNAKDEHQQLTKESFLNETNSEVIGKQNLLEDDDMEIVRAKSKEIKKRFQHCNTNVRKINVNQKHMLAPGTGRSGPRQRKKDFSVGKSQPNDQEMEAHVTQDLILQNLIEVTQEQNVINKEGTIMHEEEIQRNGQETFGWRQPQDGKIETEKGKHHVIAEENASEEQHNLGMDDSPRIIGGIGRFAKQLQHETLGDKELGLCRKQTNEVSEEQKQPPKRQQNQEHEHQEESHIEPCTDQEIERIKQKAGIKEHEDIVKSLPAGDAAATVLSTEPYGSEVEEEKENNSKEDMEWQCESPEEEGTGNVHGTHIQENPKSPSLELSSELRSVNIPFPSLEEDKWETSHKNMEQNSDCPAEDANENIRSKHAQQKPEFSLSQCSSKSKAEETSSQPQFLQQQQEVDETPQHRTLLHRILKSLTFSFML